MDSVKSPAIIAKAGDQPGVRAPATVERGGVTANVSLNFSLAKVIAIFTVMAGHWFTGTILWIPVTFGLFVFAYSSGYFTARIYGSTIDLRQFWKKKLERLGLRYWVILIFLAIVVGMKGGTVLHWHSLVHFLGMSGALNWLDIPNRSGLGAGLWFFTLLLLFYFCYPFLAKLTESKVTTWVGALAATATAVFLEMTVKVGHELWLTALGFILGVGFGRHEVKISARVAACFFALAAGCLFVINVVSNHREFNTFLIAAASISLSLWLSKVTLVNFKALIVCAKLDKYLLEIFLIHTYLFVRFSGNTALDFAGSVLLTVFAAKVLNTVVEWLTPLVLERQPKIGN